MLGLNLIIANVIVNKLFSDFIRSMASSFEIVVITTVYHFLSI
jgi:hypothetical protein